MQPRSSVLFLVFIVTLGLGVSAALLPRLIASVAGESFIAADLPAESGGSKPCRNEDGVTLVRGDTIRVGNGGLKAYFALSNEGSLPIYFSTDNLRNLTEIQADGSRIHEIKPYELEWIVLPVAEDGRPFRTTIQYRQSGFRSVRWFTAIFGGTNKFPDACS